MASTASYWCYQCTGIVSLAADGSVVCPNCNGGFVQAVDPSDFTMSPFVTAASSRRRRRRNGSSFNPVIAIRSPGGGGQRTYDLYYDGGSGQGLRPLPSLMSESLLGSGFDAMLDRLSQIGFSLWDRPENPPASKSAIASLPAVQISAGHVDSDSRCAVCTDAFALGSEAREMPCKHIYHPDCILPWLDLHSSCPICRRELPSDAADGSPVGSQSVGLSIWRLPGGGFAVGRFAGAGDGAMPAVYSEVDETPSLNGREHGEIDWAPWVRRRRGGGWRRFFDSIFRRAGRAEADRGIAGVSGSNPGSGFSIFNRHGLRRNRGGI